MAPRARSDAADLGHRIWDHLRNRAAGGEEEFVPHTHGDLRGWLWEGSFAGLIRDAIPGITDADLRRAREYLSAAGMVVNVHGHQRGQGQPQWFICADWHQGRGGHVHVVPTGVATRGALGVPTGVAAPPASPWPGPAPAAAPSQRARSPAPPEQASQPRHDVAAALGSLVQQVSELQADNDRLQGDNERLRGDNERLRGEITRIRSRAREVGEKITQQARELLEGPE